MRKEIAIVHYNTPELTVAAILSVRKHSLTDYHFTVFDNSDRRPFTKQMDGVTIIDNTKGQVIDFEAELAKYPDKEWEMAKISMRSRVKYDGNIYQILPETFHVDKPDNTIQFHMQLVNEK